MTLSCHQCQSHIVGYIQRTLPPDMRREVGAHLDTCQVCYAHYQEHLQVERDLQHYVPRLGVRTSPAFINVWRAMHQPLRPRQTTSQVTMRYGMVLVTAICILVVPFFINRHHLAAAAASTQMVPVSARITPNQPITLTSTRVAHVMPLDVQQTPEPQTVMVTGPSLDDVISTP
jgi:anti-sigma factor RsiW